MIGQITRDLHKVNPLFGPLTRTVAILVIDLQAAAGHRWSSSDQFRPLSLSGGTSTACSRSVSVTGDVTEHMERNYSLYVEIQPSFLSLRGAVFACRVESVVEVELNVLLKVPQALTRVSTQVTPGLDIIFAFIGEVYGPQWADKIAEFIPTTDSTWDPFSAQLNLTSPST